MKTFYTWTGSFFRMKNPYLLISVYLSLLAVEIFLLNRDLSLKDFSSVIPGMATFDDISIRSRVNSLYLSILVFGIILSLCVLASFLIRKHYGKLKRILLPWNYLAIIGLITLFFEVIQSKQTNLQVFIFSLAACLCALQILKYFVKNIPENYYFFIWLSGLSYSFSFFIRDLLDALVDLQKYPFSLYFAIAFFILLSGSTMLLSITDVRFRQLVKLSLPFFCFPLLTVFSRESYLILNQRSIHFLSPSAIYIIIFIFLVSIFLLVNRKKLLVIKTPLKIIFRQYIFPLILFGTCLLSFYQPIIDQPGDMFELANPANAMMRTFKYHEIPFAEYLNSHLLSEIFPGFLYVLLNGYTGTVDFLIYDFLLKSVYSIIIYFFLARILNNPIAAFLISMFLPFIYIAFPGNHDFAIITIFIAYSLYRNYSFRILLLLAFWNIFLLFWRIETGISSVAATVFLAILAIIFNFRKTWLIDFFKLTSVLAVFALIPVLILVTFGKIDLYDNLLQALDYFGASQGHGVTYLSWNKERYYSYQYFIFPAAVTIILFYLVSLFRKRSLKKMSFIYLSLLFLCAYYLFQAQRGLVRHTFIEYTDSYLCSYIFLILPLFVYYIFKKNRYSLYIFILSLILLISNFNYPDPVDKVCNFEAMTRTFERPFSPGVFDEKICRVKGTDEFAGKEYSDFKRFMDQNFSQDATFLDFSNTPMLYFYIQRKLPSYFNQYMQNTLTEFLQYKNLQELSKFDIPVVVFSHIPETWLDNTDNVPNTIRYYPVVNFIYENYRPHSIINQLYIWIRKDIHIPAPGFSFPDTLCKSDNKSYDLRKYPFLLAKSSEIFLDTTVLSKSRLTGSSSRISTGNFTSRLFNYLLIQIRNESGKDVPGIIKYFADQKSLGEFAFVISQEKDAKHYLIPVSAQYNWVSCEPDSIRINFDLNEGIFADEITIFKRTGKR